MKLKTSFFNGSVLKKDITRFMPLWAIYTIMLFMSQMLIWGNNVDSCYRAADIAGYKIQSMSVLTFLYAGICAVTLFGDLYVPRMCNALHAMPMRREGWFLTHTASGLLFGLVPNLLAALISIPMLKNYYYVAFYWLGGAMLQYVFFFGLALLCVMCAGSRLGMIAIYGILNFFSMFVYGLVQTFYIPLLYGVVLQFKPFAFLCPVFQIASNSLIETRINYPQEKMVIESFVSSSWNYLFALAAIGVVLTALAVLIYRRRQLERAGDFLAIPQLSPVFLLIVTLGSGMLFYLFTSLFSTTSKAYLFLFLGMAVGYFVGRMLLDRTVRVFHLKSILGYVIIAVLMGASLGLTRLDPLGIVTRVPSEDEILYGTLSISYYQPSRREVTDPVEIHQIVEFHEALCRERPDDPDSTSVDSDYMTYMDYQVQISYQLTNGRTLERTYHVNTRNETGREVVRYVNTWQNLLGTDDLEELASLILESSFTAFDSSYSNSTIYDLHRADLPKVLDAIKADAEAGSLQKYSLSPSTEAVLYSLDFGVSNGEKQDELVDRWINLSVSENCIHILSVLNELRENQVPREDY